MAISILATAPLDANTTYGDFRDALARDGFVVVPGVIEPKAAGAYVSQCHSWVESFELGYKRDDPATHRVECVPNSFKGGLYNRYGVAHEQVCWNIREEPKVIEAFARVWGTDDLLVSFDGINLSIPGVASKEATAAWPHVDQSPSKTWLHCIQGIVNLAPNGPEDGGLQVLIGSRPLYAELFEVFKRDMPEGGWSDRDVYVFKEDHLAWFEEKGCTWHKICANPGDLLLWDSRTCHYGAQPTGKNFRVATYVCYKPRALATAEQLLRKQQVFLDHSLKLSHDPIAFDEMDALPTPGEADPAFAKRAGPLQPPFLSEVGMRLAGF